MDLFALYFNLLFYIELSFGFWITRILKKENPEIELFPPSADLTLDNMCVCVCVCVCVWISLFRERGYIYPNTFFTSRMRLKNSFLEAQVVWIQNFPSSWFVSIPRLKSPSAQLFSHSLV